MQDNSSLQYDDTGFLPVTAKQAGQVDFVLVTGDAYVDHPSFGAAIIGRLLQSMGFSVSVLAQPDWKSDSDFRRFGRPRLGFFVTAGNIDSMVAHYTSAKKPRSDDAYSPGGKNGRRPDRAVIVYCNRIREAYGDVPLVIGGLEGSLRRFAHYDYWDDRVRGSVLVDSGADILVYGMGESQTREIARRLERGEPPREIEAIAGTCVVRSEVPGGEYVPCPSFEEVKRNKELYAKAAKVQFIEADSVRGRTVVQPHGRRYLICYPPAPPLSRSEMDRIYSLPFTRMYHPQYEAQGGVPAIEEVEFSITSCRGCFGGCNFCSLAFHQGRMITSRSHKSILAEATAFTNNPRFKGYISDVGGPTANFRAPSCRGQKERGMCAGRSCLSPRPCKNLIADHSDYIELLKKLREVEGVKRVFIRSGVRYDYLMADKSGRFLEELCAHHISGRLKVAPEHCSEGVLNTMGKPSIDVYRRFAARFDETCRRLNKEQYLVPYLMSSHPGSTLKDAIELALFLKESGLRPEQVQDFYPTPGTLSTAMYYSGIDPMTGKEVYVPKSARERRMQRALLQFSEPKNRHLVMEALKEAGREDLIGFKPNCLIAPRDIKGGPRGKRVKKGDSFNKKWEDNPTFPGKKQVKGKKDAKGGGKPNAEGSRGGGKEGKRPAPSDPKALSKGKKASPIAGKKAGERRKKDDYTKKGRR